MKKILKFIYNKMPCHIIKLVIFIFLIFGKKKNEKILEILGNSYEKKKMRKYARRLYINFKGECERIKKGKKYIVIDEENKYGLCNGCYLSDMISTILEAMFYGYIPVFKEEKGKEYFTWVTFFKQPRETMFGEIDLNSCKKVEFDKYKHLYRVNFDLAFNKKDFDFAFFAFFYKKCIVLNDEVREYIKDELKIIKGKRVLGVLIRGTDYITLKPEGHPQQPSIEEIILKVREKLNKRNYDALYVASEEERFVNIIKSNFIDKEILVNKRCYYDRYYTEGKEYVNEVSFDRENDNTLKGLQYFSSMIILSRCDEIVAGNCGGTLLAMLMSKTGGQWYVFNRGYY